MESCESILLNSGYKCPMLGYGTWQSKDPAALNAGLKAAIAAGYRHIDTAHVYGNEKIIGDTLQELYDAGVVKREDLFLTTKIFGTHYKPDLVVDQLRSQLASLKTTYVDLYLMHHPVPLQLPDPSVKGLPVKYHDDGKVALDTETKIEDTWKSMEKCVELGLARSIGLSNFNISQVERFLKCKIKPAMNQVESHPAFQNTKLIDFCQKNGVVVTGYSCFGSPGTILIYSGKPLNNLKLLEDEKILSIGKKYGKNAAQVILRWQIQRNVIVIPKSVTASRIEDNFNVWDFKLSDDDMTAMAEMDVDVRYSLFAVPGIKEHPEYPHTEDRGSC